MSAKTFSSKTLVAFLLIGLMIGTSMAYGLNSTGIIGNGHVPPKVSVNVDYIFELSDGTGAAGAVGNQLQDLGNAYIANITVGRTMTSYTYGVNGTVYIALGNGTSLSYADTKLTTECAASNTGFKRSAALTPTYASGTGIGNGNHYNFTISNKFTATEITTINCTSIQWSGAPVSDNNMFAEASIGTLPTGQLFNVNDNCTISWTITITK